MKFKPSNTIKGLTAEETDLLRLVFTLKPWGRDKISKKVGKFLNGEDNLDEFPALRDRINNAINATERR